MLLSDLITRKKSPMKRLLFSQQTQRHSSLVINQIGFDNQCKGLINRNSFYFFFAIGRGGYGKVWKVDCKRTKKLFAIKTMHKLRIISKNSVNSVMNERKILETLKYPFIVNMHYAFQDREYLYLVLDFKKGGDLRYQLSKLVNFNEEQLKFLTACVLLGLKYIHSKGVIHRDIKPENLVFDEAGYLFITDFGISRFNRIDNRRDTSGTPSYMAPEVIFRQNHNFLVDYYALGTVLYELIRGKRPYYGKERKEIRASMLCRQAKLPENMKNISKELIDFVNKLLIRKANSRLGHGGFEEISNHPWFIDFDWELLEKQKMIPPFTPKVRESFDPTACTEFKDELDYSIDLGSSQGLFSGYSYDCRLTENKVFCKRQSL